MSEKMFTTSSSKEVKIMSALSLVLLTVIIISVLFMNVSGVALLTRLFIVGLIFLAIGYFFSISLKKILLSNDSIILYKNIGSEIIRLETISCIERLAFSNFTTTYGSKGIFGFNGSLMEDSKTLVNDRKKMLKIYTSKKNYIISCDEPGQLIKEIEKRKRVVGGEMKLG